MDCGDLTKSDFDQINREFNDIDQTKRIESLELEIKKIKDQLELILSKLSN